MNEESKMKWPFGISKCVTLVFKEKNFIPSRHYKNLPFKLDMNNLPTINQYINIYILEYPSMNHWIKSLLFTKMNSKINY